MKRNLIMSATAVTALAVILFIGCRQRNQRGYYSQKETYAERVHNSFLYGGSIGLAVNPSRYFGAFYELAYNNLNKEMIDFFANEIRMKPIQRFGLNIRFGGPKKWQR